MFRPFPAESRYQGQLCYLLDNFGTGILIRYTDKFGKLQIPFRLVACTSPVLSETESVCEWEVIDIHGKTSHIPISYWTPFYLLDVADESKDKDKFRQDEAKKFCRYVLDGSAKP